MGFEDTRTLYMIRPAPPAVLASSCVYAWLALRDPGIVAEQCFRTLQWYVCMCDGVGFACAVIGESLVHATARAGAIWARARGSQGLAKQVGNILLHSAMLCIRQYGLREVIIASSSAGHGVLSTRRLCIVRPVPFPKLCGYESMPGWHNLTPALQLRDVSDSCNRMRK